MDKITTTGINFPRGLASLSDLDTSLEKAKNLSGRDVKNDKQIDKASKGFEALLLHEMLKSLWETVEVKGWLGEDSNEAKIYRDMMNQAISDSIAEGRGIGIKDVVRKELEKQSGASKGKVVSGEAVAVNDNQLDSKE